MYQDMQNTPRTRVARGVHEGGQFATEVRAEANVSLLDHTDASPVPGMKELDPDEMLQVALVSARHHSRVKGLRFTDPRDIAQSTVETVLAARKRNPGQVVTRAYVNQVTSGHVAIALRGSLRQEDHKAIGIYTHRLQELEAELGRKTSGEERKALAKDIRDNWHDQRHKPSEDFVARAEMRIVSLDRTVGDGEQTLGELIAERHGTTDDDMAVDEESKLGRALQAATSEGTRGRGKAEARQLVWAAIAEHAGVADAVPGSVTRSQAKVHREVMSQAGGVAQAVRDWNNGDDRTAACRSLFAPFGRLTADQKDELVEVFVAHSAYADDLYDAALKSASN